MLRLFLIENDIVIAEENFTNWRVAWKKLKNMKKDNVKIKWKV